MREKKGATDQGVEASWRRRTKAVAAWWGNCNASSCLLLSTMPFDAGATAVAEEEGRMVALLLCFCLCVGGTCSNGTFLFGNLATRHDK